MAVRLGPLLGREQHHRGAVGQRRGVPGGHRGRLALAEDRLELGELLDRGVGAQVLVALEAAERRDLVVEEPGVVRRGEVLVRRGGELVLLLAPDLPLQRGQRGVVAHRQAGARLAVLRDRRDDVARPDLRQRGEPALEVLGAVQLEQDLAEVLADRDRGVRGRVGAAGDADVDLPERDLVRDLDRGLQAGAAGLLDVGGRRLRGELRAEDGLAGQVEVAGVLEHGAGDDLTDALALEAEPGDQAVDGGGQHLLVGRRRVDGVRAGERDPVAAQDGDATSLRFHAPILAATASLVGMQ